MSGRGFVKKLIEAEGDRMGTCNVGYRLKIIVCTRAEVAHKLRTPSSRSDVITALKEKGRAKAL